MQQRKNMDTQRVPNRDINAGHRVAEALKLRTHKLTYDEIAHRCGYGSASACRKAVQRELNRVVVTNVDELRREECVTLDLLQADCMKLFLDEKNTGRLWAVDRVLAIMERRAKLMSLDARPEESTTQQNYTKRIVLVPPSLEVPDASTNG